MNDDYKITADWVGIKEKYAEAGIDISDLLVPNDICTIAYDNSADYSSICSAPNISWHDYETKIDELEQKLKQKEDEVIKLKEMIEYCKHNGIWIEK